MVPSMTALFRFVEVRCDGSDRAYSFTLHSGEMRLLQLSSGAEKEAMIDVATGETVCGEGSVDIVQIPRMEDRDKGSPSGFQVAWHPLSTNHPGRVGWVAANGGLISNLKIWENVTLPLWYHARREVTETEQSVIHWLGILGLEQQEFSGFMAAPPSSIAIWQRKLAGLLRALVQQPEVLVVDAAVFEDIKEPMARNWIMALEAYAAQGHAVLAIADKATALPWDKIE